MYLNKTIENLILDIYYLKTFAWVATIFHFVHPYILNAAKTLSTTLKRLDPVIILSHFHCKLFI